MEDEFECRADSRDLYLLWDVGEVVDAGNVFGQAHHDRFEPVPTSKPT
jgi:hypothetical protein